MKCRNAAKDAAAPEHSKLAVRGALFFPAGYFPIFTVPAQAGYGDKWPS
jgi:hypothetical protein